MSRRTSKFLSLILRHRPESVGLTLDPSGWVEVEQLLRSLKRHGHNISRAELDEIVATNNKRRFRFSEDGRYIRANQGHSVKVELGLQSVEPPPTLFHGTVERFLPSILQQGLKPGKRQQVHLSHDTETARAVGARRGDPVILKIDGASMYSDGHLFFRSENGVWLTEGVPPRYISRV